MRHHYVPVFYLRQWSEAPDQKVPYFRWINGKFVQGRISPYNTGYEVDLNARQKTPEEERHSIEENIFSTLDNVAAPIHRRFISLEKFTPTNEERTAWAAFLIAANLRSPDFVAEAKASSAEELQRELEKNPEEYERIRAGAPHLTLSDWVDRHWPGLVENFGLDMMVRYLTSEERLLEIMRLHWTAHSVPRSNVPLLTGDRPLWNFGPLDHSHFTLVMPLSPRVMFVASRTDEFAKAVIDEGDNSIARKLNGSIIQRAKERVYGRAKLSFVERMFRGGDPK